MKYPPTTREEFDAFVDEVFTRGQSTLGVSMAVSAFVIAAGNALKISSALSYGTIGLNRANELLSQLLKRLTEDVSASLVDPTAATDQDVVVLRTEDDEE